MVVGERVPEGERVTAPIRRFCGSCGASFPEGAAGARETCASCGAGQAALEDASSEGVERGMTPIGARWFLLALLGVVLAFLYAFHYIGISHPT